MYEDAEIRCKRLVVADDNGREVIVSPDGFVIEGPSGRIEAAFAGDGCSPYVRLESADGRSRVTIRAGDDSTGAVFETPAASATVVTSGLDLTRKDQQIVVTAAGLFVRDADGRDVIRLPFTLPETKASIGRLARAIARRLGAVGRV